MADYSPLFSFVVVHGFYDGGIVPGLRFVATPKSARLIDNAGLLVKSTSSGITVSYNKKDRESLQLYAADKEEPLELVFKGYASDASFRSRTDTSLAEKESLLYFNNHKKIVDGDDRIRLHDAEDVSIIDNIRLDSIQLQDVLDHRERRLPPLFVVSIQITEEDLAQLDEHSSVVPKSYYIRFKERQVFWMYYLVGCLARENLFLVDVDGKADFICSGKTLLDDQRETIVFHTADRLSLKANLNYRFQLKEKDNGSEKVIIKRLPMADVTHFGRALIDGRDEVVSEIYINC